MAIVIHDWPIVRNIVKHLKNRLQSGQDTEWVLLMRRQTNAAWRQAAPVFIPLGGVSIYTAWHMLVSVERTPPRCGRRLWQVGALPV